jgi:inosose dehydratase
MERRKFIQSTAFAVGSTAFAGISRANNKNLHVSCNAYTWGVYYKREGKDFKANLDAGLKAAADSGLDGFEPSFGSIEEVDIMLPLLKKHHLLIRSFYTGSLLHEPAKVMENINKILLIAGRTQKAGSSIVVTNPSPLKWGGAENKNDDQLKIQADALNKLGQKLDSMGMILAYHNHDIELRHAARELHHMMVGTEPDYVKLCLDLHWVYRGAGNSNVALFDIMKLYNNRIVELHIRQSTDLVWSETFTAKGDLDYEGAAAFLKKKNSSPLLVLEQAVEKGTPFTMDAVKAHRASCFAVRNLFS